MRRLPILIPHRPGCADFPLPVLHGRASLTEVQMTPSVTCRQRKTRGRTSALVSILASSATRCRFVDRFVRLTVLSTWHPAFLDRVPVSPVPRCPRYYRGATTSRHAYPVTYLLRFRGPRDPLRFVSRNLRSRLVGGTFQARVIVRPATRTAGSLARGRERDLPGFQAIHPVPLPRSTTPAEPTTPRLLTVSSMLPPHFPRRRLQRLMNFGALSRGFGTCCLRFKNDVATIPAKLASGWLARLYREGVEPSGSLQKVSDHIPILLFWICPGAREVSFLNLALTLHHSITSSARLGSLRLDVGRPDHLTPFLCLLDDNLVEFGRRARKRRCAQVSEPRRDLGIGEPRIDLLVELVNDFDGRVPGSSDPNPRAGLEAWLDR